MQIVIASIEGIPSTYYTYYYSNRPETNIAESVWAFFADLQHIVCVNLRSLHHSLIKTEHVHMLRTKEQQQATHFPNPVMEVIF